MTESAIKRRKGLVVITKCKGNSLIFFVKLNKIMGISLVPKRRSFYEKIGICFRR